ncbi:MAG TPA: hypothetical protein VJ508_03850 [Saprospiraceae bacterium]|nr:hypothetical protein [Saprospiraceae bacterium]
MNREVIRTIIRALLILLVQVLILKRIGLGHQWIWQHGHIFLYPIIVLLLPFRMSRHYVILIGFCIGLMMDMFYDTVGVHAFAMTAMAYGRGKLLVWLEPRGGYTLSMSPTNYAMGINWLMIFTSVSMFVFTLLYFIAEIFTFVYLGQILLKTIITFILSMLIVMGYHFLFNPRK